MKKTIAITLAALLVLALGVSFVRAAPGGGPGYGPGQGFGPGAGYQSNLTAEQQKELTPLFDKMTDLQKQRIELQKQLIQKQVSFGNLTQEQADWRIGRLKERSENIGKGYGPGMMGGRGFGGGRGCGFGPGGYGPGSGPQQQAPK